MAKKKELSLQEQAAEILRLAKEYDVSNNFLFTTTFKRYVTQINVLENLSKTISQEDILVTKEYVKGRENIYVHPAVKEFNNTTNSANTTVKTLLSLIETAKQQKNAGYDVDPLWQVLNGGGEDDDE